MTINYNVTGAERKRLADYISGFMGTDKKYLGAPTFAYQIGYLTVSKDGAVSFEDWGYNSDIDALMADDDIPDTFVYVPAHCFPTHPVGLADLIAYRVRKKFQTGSLPSAMLTVHNTELPVLLQAEYVLQTQEALGETYTEEEFFAKYNAIAHAGELPEEIGMTFGNTVAYVHKQPSCAARLAEVLVCKKFICSNADGFQFIKAQLKLLYARK